MSILEKLKRRQAEKVAETSAYDTSSSFYQNDENFNSENAPKKPTHHRKSAIQREKMFSSSSSSDNQISLIQRSRMQEELFARNCNETRRNKRPADSSNSSSSSPQSNYNGRREYQYRLQEDSSTVTAGVLHLKKPLVNANNDFYYEDRGRMAPMDWNQIHEDSSPTKSVDNSSPTHQTPKPRSQSKSHSELKSDDEMLNFIRNTKTPETIYKVRGNMDRLGKSNDSLILKIEKMRDRNCCKDLLVDKEINGMFSVKTKSPHQPQENGFSNIIDEIDRSADRLLSLQVRESPCMTNGGISNGYDSIRRLRKEVVDENGDYDHSNTSSVPSASKLEVKSSTPKVRSRVDDTDDDAFKFVRQTAVLESSSPSTSSLSPRSSSSSEKFKKLTQKVSAASKDILCPPTSVKEEIAASISASIPDPKDEAQNRSEKTSSRVDAFDDDAFVYEKPKNKVSLKFSQSICSAMDSDDMSLDRSSIFENSSVFPVPDYEEIQEKPQSFKAHQSKNIINSVRKIESVEKQNVNKKESDSKELSPEFFSNYFTNLKKKGTVNIANIVENNDDNYIPTSSSELLKPVATRYFSDKKTRENDEQRKSCGKSPSPRKINRVAEINNDLCVNEEQQSGGYFDLACEKKSQIGSSPVMTGVQAKMNRILSVTKTSDSCSRKDTPNVAETKSEKLNREHKISEVSSAEQKIRKIRNLTSSSKTGESRSTDSYTSDSLNSSDPQRKSSHQETHSNTLDSHKFHTSSQSLVGENLHEENCCLQNLTPSTRMQQVKRVHSDSSDCSDTHSSRGKLKQQKNSIDMARDDLEKFNSPPRNSEAQNSQTNLSPKTPERVIVESNRNHHSNSFLSDEGIIQVEEVSSTNVTGKAHPFTTKIDQSRILCDSNHLPTSALDDDDESVICFGYSNSNKDATVIQTLHIPPDNDPNESLECDSSVIQNSLNVHTNGHNVDKISNYDSSEDSDIDSIHCITISSTKKEGSSVIIQEINDADEPIREDEHIETIKSSSTPETMKYQADINDIDSQEEFDVVGFEDSEYFEQMAKFLGVNDIYSEVRPSSSSSQQLEIM